MRIYLKRLFVILSIYFSSYNQAVSQNWQWSKQIGSEKEDWAIGTCDANGNFYVAGNYEGSQCRFPDTLLGNNQFNAMFIAKYDKDGQEQWVRQIGYGDSEYRTSGFGDVVVDDQGFLYITGMYYNYLVFDSVILHSGGNGDIFIAKINPDGSCAWAKRAGGALDDGGSGIAIDSVYSVYISGLNEGQANFDSISIIRGGFIAKYSSSGHCLWAKNKSKYYPLYHSPDFWITGMTIYHNNLLACGYMQNDTIQIDTIKISHEKNIFGSLVCCYDLDANIRWVKQGISPGALGGVNISTDKEGNIYTTGQFYDSINFDGSVMRNPAKRGDAFFCKYSESGSLLWARNTNATLGAYGMSILPDSAGNCYATGWFCGLINFENENIVSETSQDLFLAKYGTNGDLTGLSHFGYAEGMQLGLDRESNPYVVGRFKGTVHVGQTTMSSYGYNDILLCRGDKISGLMEPIVKIDNQLAIYANPTTGKCNIAIPKEFLYEKSLTLTVCDNQGRVIQSIPVKLSGDKIRLDLSAESTGIYNAVLTNGYKLYSGRIVVY